MGNGFLFIGLGVNIMDKYDYLTSGEELKCSCGTEKAELKVAVRRTLTIDDKRIATMVDSLPEDNIGCFGQCMANPDAPAPCMFEGFWVDGCKRVTVDGFPALTKNSALICTKGQGVIVPRDNEIVEEKYKKILEGKNGLQKIHNKNNK